MQCIRNFASTIAVIIFCSIAIASNEKVPVYGQANQLTVMVELDRYTSGDTIVVTGRLNATTINQPLLIQVFDPEGNRDRIDQINVAADGGYRYTFTAGGLMNTAGLYKIEVSYKGVTSAETSFEFVFLEPPGRIFRIVIDGQEYFIQYLITGEGNRLLNITTDFSRNATFPGDAWLIVSLSTQSDGTLSLRFSKEFFDANEEFIAFVDGNETEVKDESYGTTNVISIDFIAGTTEILITGDHIIPEFGSSFIAVTTGVAAVLALVVVSGRYRIW